jgi:exopolyphosphatase/guanosine-5'-triphosphate,3'-diphosphate pyrophosphatase
MKAIFFDVGSNSIRCMTAERNENGCAFSSKKGYTTHLAKRLAETGRLSEESMQRSLNAIRACLAWEQARDLPAYAYATSAVRDAENGSDFAEQIRELGVQVRILRGEEEARYAFLASGASGGMMDIGGGSCQLVTGRNAESFPIGCVRAMSYVSGGDLDSVRKELRPVLERVFADLSPWTGIREWKGVGGTITSLAAGMKNLERYSRKAVSGYRISPEGLDRMLRELDGMKREGRERHPVFTARKDTILPGGTILQYLMERLGMESVEVSDMDGLEGYALSVLFGEGGLKQFRFEEQND